MAFAKSTQARLPHFPGYPGTFTTLQTSFHNADRPIAPPRFDPGLSTGPGGFTTEDLGVSPDRTFTGWLTRVIARLRHDHSFTVVVIAPEQLDARGSRLSAEDLRQQMPPVYRMMYKLVSKPDLRIHSSSGGLIGRPVECRRPYADGIPSSAGGVSPRTRDPSRRFMECL